MDKHNCISMIQELSNAFGPSGFEDDVQNVIKKYVSSIGTVEVDTLRNLYIYRTENSGYKPILMLDAHSDEVGFMVHSVNGDGTVRFVPLGGWNKMTLLGTKVKVRNSLGKYLSGLVSSKTPQFMNTDERNKFNADFSKMAIDVGSTSYNETLNSFHIRSGEPCIPDTEFSFNKENGLMIGKAFDCRLGCAALIETLNRIHGLELPFDIVGVFSSQEELGDRGCKVAVNHVHPQIAFCFEGSPADDTYMDSYTAQTALKKGPMFRFMDKSLICSPRYQRFVLDLASNNGIQVQCGVREHGGNNGSVINTAFDGIPVIVAGIPVRYIHTSSSFSYYDDFESSVQIAVKVIQTLSEDLMRTF